MDRDLRVSWRMSLAMVGMLAGAALPGLRVETQRAWSTYVEATERRIARELTGGPRFLVLDFGSVAAQDRAALRASAIVSRKMQTTDDRGHAIDVPSAMVHHWTGSVFVPGTHLDAFLRELRRTPPETYQQDVIRSSTHARDPDTTEMFLRVQRTRIVTVVYDTEHVVVYARESPTRASSTSHATRIAELADPGTPAEREKPPGQDRGFLWAWNSYWRYEQVEGGVIVECESVSMSRSIPSLVRYLIGPVIDGLASESLERTLAAIRGQFQGR